MVSHAMEDYIAAIWRLTYGGGVATTSAVARKLGVTAATTSYMFKKMAEAGLVDYKEYVGATLTPAGEVAATAYIRRHRVTERFLVDVLGIGWERADALSDQMEHSMPDEVIDRMEAVLGHPTTCPHGYPIPTREGAIRQQHLMELTKVPSGEEATIARVSEHDSRLLEYFGEHSLRPGSRLRVVSIDSIGGTLTVQVSGAPQPLVLSAAVARWIQVEC